MDLHTLHVLVDISQNHTDSKLSICGLNSQHAYTVQESPYILQLAKSRFQHGSEHGRRSNPMNHDFSGE